MTGSLALFDLRRRNVTVNDPVNSGFKIATGEQRSRGLELEVGADLRHNLKLTGSYTYMDAKVTQDTDLTLVGRPRCPRRATRWRSGPPTSCRKCRRSRWALADAT